MKYIKYALVLLLIVDISSCNFIYPSFMFRQKDYRYFELAKKQMKEYVIDVGDEFTIQVFARDGFRLIDVMGSMRIRRMMGISYIVDHEGYARLPIIGDMYVKGYTEMELERILAEKYSNIIVDPFVVLRVTNRRVFLFKGITGGNVVGLPQAPTTIIEVLAKSGGLSRNLKAYKIKIIRGDLKNPEIIMVNLSTLEGIRKADLYVQSGDIIYIEERRRYVNDVLREFGPVFTVVNTITTITLLTRRFSN